MFHEWIEHEGLLLCRWCGLGARAYAVTKKKCNVKRPPNVVTLAPEKMKLGVDMLKGKYTSTP